MFLLAITIVLLTLSSVGYGSLFEKKDFLSTLTRGFGFILIITAVFYLFRPLTSTFSVTLILLGCILGIKQFLFQWNANPRPTLTHKHIPALLLLFIFILCVLYAASFPIEWYDSLLYHIPVVSLFSYQKIIPGIALLHERFGFISSTFSLTALSTLLPMSRQSLSIVNATYMAWFGLLAYSAFTGLRNGKSQKSAYSVLIGLFSLLIFHGLSLTPTLAPEIGISFWLTAALIFFQREQSSDGLLATVLALWSKPSAIPFVFMAFLFCIFQRKKILNASFIQSGILLILYGITSIILTGYALFPDPHSHLPLFSKSDITTIQTQNLKDTVHTWARFPPQFPKESTEFGFFTHIFLPQIPVSIQITALSICVLIIRTCIRKPAPYTYREFGIPLLIVSITVLLYIQAPDIRLLWPFGILILESFFSVLMTGSNMYSKKIGSAVLLVLLLIACISSIPKVAIRRRSQMLLPVETVYNMNAEKKYTNSGFAYTTSISNDDRCGVAKPICISDVKRLQTVEIQMDAQKNATRILRKE